MMQQADVAVIGAGPAGSSAARAAARSGARVWLIERSSLPRGKVCGCCVNRGALETLQSTALPMDELCAMGEPLHRMHLAAGSARASFELPGGLAVSRSRLDDYLARAAAEAGAHFMQQTRASWQGTDERGHRLLLEQGPRQQLELHARVVIACDGLAGGFCRQVPGLEPVVSRGSRIGAGAMVRDAGAAIEPGVVYMACGRAGYLGMVRLADDWIDLAMACDTQAMREHGSPAALAEHLLDDAGLTGPVLASVGWHGTATLTRRRLAAGWRVLIAGDAAGYVEPFTGQGIHWAIGGGWSAGTLALRGVDRWDRGLERTWAAEYGQRVGAQQRRCRWMARALRHQHLRRGVIALGRRWPGGLQRLAAYVCRG